jgi:hypothetical protein
MEEEASFYPQCSATAYSIAVRFHGSDENQPYDRWLGTCETQTANTYSLRAKLSEIHTILTMLLSLCLSYLWPLGAKWW